MPIVEPDFSEAIDFSPIKPGNYPSRATSFTPTTAKSSGNPILKGKVTLVVDGKEREREVNWPYTGKGAGSFQQYCRAIGRSDIAESSQPFDTDEIVNIEFTAVVDQQEYEGTMRDYIVACLPAS